MLTLFLFSLVVITPSPTGKYNISLSLPTGKIIKSWLTAFGLKMDNVTMQAPFGRNEI